MLNRSLFLNACCRRLPGGGQQPSLGRAAIYGHTNLLAARPGNSELNVSRPLYQSAVASARHNVGVIVGVRLNVRDPEQAKQFLTGLSKKEKRALLEELVKTTKAKRVSQSDIQTAFSELETDPIEIDSVSTGPVPSADLRTLFLLNTIPFIGFGFLDNFIMIVAGEYIDITLGVWLHISTMAAAGFGNLISDAVGVGAGGYIEYLVHRFTNLQPPKMSHEQANSGRVRYVTSFGRTFGIVIGCLVGMFPLLFFDENKKKELLEEEEEEEKEAAAKS